MISQKLFRGLLTSVVVLSGLYLVVTGVVPPDKSLKILTPIGFVTASTMGLEWLLNHHLWRWRFVHRLLKAAPDAQGTWKGELHSHWLDEVGQRPATIEIYAVVRQTLTTVSVRMFTAESSSETVSASIKSEDGSGQILATYRNTPDLDYQQKSRTHFGSFLLKITGAPAQTLKGHYWTDRNSNGEFMFSEHKSALVGDFQAAQSLFSQSVINQGSK